MAEQFLRIGGTDGQFARAIKTDENGNIGVYEVTYYNVLRQSNIRKGSYTTVQGNNEFTILNWRDLGTKTLSWYLSMIEHSRPTNELLDTLKIKIEYATEENPSPENIVFTKLVDLSLNDELDKGLIITPESNYEQNDNRMSNIILRNKPFNLPIARYLKVTLVNTATPNHVFRGIVLTEEGMYR